MNDVGIFDMSRYQHFCPVCGKEFYSRGSDYGYTLPGRRQGSPPRYFCSWTCLRKAEAERAAKKKARKRKKQP